MLKHIFARRLLISAELMYMFVYTVLFIVQKLAVFQHDRLNNLQYTGYCNTLRSVEASLLSRNEAAGGLINSLNVCVMFLSEFHANNLRIVWQCVKQVTAACSYKVRQLPAAKYQRGTLDKRLT
jgi:hypothetical protein